MEISIQQLLSSYCQELNESWTETVAPLKDQQISFENIKPFLDKFREAEREGYSFELVYCPLILINKLDSNSSFDKEMMESVNWRDIDVINKMKKQGKENDWNPMDKPLSDLRIERVRTIAGSFLQSFVLENGPFFLSKDPSCLLAYCNMQSIAHEISLISILKSKTIENEKSKNRR
jgi:hypothetical protein